MTERAAGHEELDPETIDRWRRYGQGRGEQGPFFAQHLGLVVEEVRRDDCRIRMVFRPELMQGGGVMHGGAIAEGWVVRRGRRIVFGQSEVRDASTDRLVATSVLTYHVSAPAT